MAANFAVEGTRFVRRSLPAFGDKGRDGEIGQTLVRMKAIAEDR